MAHRREICCKTLLGCNGNRSSSLYLVSSATLPFPPVGIGHFPHRYRSEASSYCMASYTLLTHPPDGRHNFHPLWDPHTIASPARASTYFSVTPSLLSHGSLAPRSPTQ